MATNPLEMTVMDYPGSLLDEWKRGDYSFLTSSKAPQYIKDILVHKARERPGKRFFGEAYIAATLGKDMTDGWYNSYKWLTANKWITGRNLEPSFEAPFYVALKKRIGVTRISNLQKRTNTYFETHESELEYKKPVAPDLWFINKSGGFVFIESKMDRDRISPHQLAGLALIKKHLPGSVALMWLYRAGKTPPAPEDKRDHIDTFSVIYRSV